MTELDDLLNAYQHTLRSVLAATDDLDEQQWARPTRCPGWSVHDQVAHIVGLETMLAGDAVPAEAPAADFVRGRVGQFMQRAVYARRDQPAAELRADLAAVIPRRQEQLRGRALEQEVPGLLGRPMALRVLLPLRVYDVWAHEQDIRAALGNPGNLCGPGADVSWQAMHWGLSDALASAGAAPGQRVCLRVTGARPDTMTAALDTADTDSAASADTGGTGHAETATATIELDWADLVARMCGRAGSVDTPVHVSGDTALAARVLAALPMTP